MDAQLSIANVLSRTGKLDETIRYCDKLIERDPDFTPAYRTRGYALQQQGKLEEAIAQYEKVGELDPRDKSFYPYLAQCRNGLAWSLVRLPGSTAEDAGRGLKLAKQACEVKPKNAQYLTTLGVAYYRTGDWKSARETLQKSINLRRNHPLNWLPLAMTCRQLGDQDEARMWYDKAIQWRKKHEPDEELQGFFEEAEKLLEPAPDDKQFIQFQHDLSAETQSLLVFFDTDNAMPLTWFSLAIRPQRRCVLFPIIALLRSDRHRFQ